MDSNALIIDLMEICIGPKSGPDLSSPDTQLVLEMNVAGGNKGMDTSIWGRCHGVSAGLDVATGGAGQTTDNRAVLTTNLLGNALHSSEITTTGKRESSLNHIHAKTGQLLRNRQLLLEVEAGPGGLFTISESGVEDQYAAWILGHG